MEIVIVPVIGLIFMVVGLSQLSAGIDKIKDAMRK